ncbi:MAG: 4-alpha-glucanotransferase [Candidatus Saganbacteria bacterium]|nr:4-alpha-glucanotransferase [Candidatus Saganbacteria bacterium]
MKKSGILLHISSLPSSYGIGDLGPEAYRFADQLKRAGQSVWQILPLTETMRAGGNSPYHGLSAFAGNTYFISPDLLLEAGWLKHSDLKPRPRFPKDRVDFDAMYTYKDRLFSAAYERFKQQRPPARFKQFCLDNAAWLDDFALFKALKVNFGDRNWAAWPKKIRERDKTALAKASQDLAGLVTKQKFLQYLFFQQWSALKNYCHKQGIKLFGDMPIYVEHNSVDVWQDPEIFQLNENGRPVFVSGVPPDYFSKTGQLWGHPVYNWQALKQTRFAWWIERVAQNLRLFDLIRIDHFRGLVAFWQVRAGAKTAAKGEWIEAPVNDLLDALKKHFSELPLVAEDLGIITPDVKQVMEHYNIPGMRVLVFAFGEDNPWHPYLPENYLSGCIAYTGTHDTNTVRGWFDEEATRKERNRVFKYLGKRVSEREISWEFIKLVLNSRAELAVIPVQDVLSLASEGRMNMPAQAFGNWQWRLRPGQFKPALIKKLARLTRISGRA